MPPLDNNAIREELDELEVALLRKRSEVSNLTVGYQRAVEGLSPIPAATLRRNLVEQRTRLTELEARIAELRARLGGSA